MLTKKMQTLDKELKNLRFGKVIEKSGLEKEESNYLKDYYQKAYIVIGPDVDKKNPKMYRLAFMKKSNQINSDYGVPNA